MKISNKKVFLYHTILIPSNESASFEMKTYEDDTPIILTVIFEDTENEKEEKQTVSISANSNHTGTIRFKNWNSPVGSSISSPVVFAKSDDGEKISFIANVICLGDMHKLDIQFMLGD